MSDEWMTKNVRAGDRIAHRILAQEGNPVHPGVELGRAAGVLAVKFYELHGESAAKSFLETLVEVFNLETAQVNFKKVVVRLKTDDRDA